MSDSSDVSDLWDFGVPARACCRRVERAVVAVHGVSPVRPEIFAYLNRLSDLLFAWARQANEDKGVPEVPWTST